MPTIEWNKRWGQDLNKFIHAENARQYGYQWGDPTISGLRYWIAKLRGKTPGDLTQVVKNYIAPYITKDTVLLEIGVGGGRWTPYMLDAKELILVDLNSEFFPYLQERFKTALSRLRFYQTKGYELDGIESDSVDFVFSFGTFVHIDPVGIDTYLGQIKRVLKAGGIAVIHYGDRNKKYFQSRYIQKRKRNDKEFPVGFSDMNAEKMQAFLTKHGFQLLDHNTSLLNHSNIVVIQKEVIIS